jgi:hypothetical protein
LVAGGRPHGCCEVHAENTQHEAGHIHLQLVAGTAASRSDQG